MKQQLWLAVLLAAVSISLQQSAKCKTKEQVLKASPYFPRFSVDFKSACNKYWAGNEAERVPCVVVANQVTAFFANNMDKDAEVLETIFEKLKAYAGDREDRMAFVATTYIQGADGNRWGSADELFECLAVSSACKWTDKVLNRNSNGVTLIAAALTKMCTAATEQAECTTLKNDVNIIINNAQMTVKLPTIAAKMRAFIGSNTQRMILMGSYNIDGLTETHKLLDLVTCQYQGSCDILKYMIAVDSKTGNSYASSALQEGCKTLDSCSTVVTQFKQGVHNSLSDAVRLQNAKTVMQNAGLTKYKHGMVGTWGTLSKMMACSV